MTGLLLAFWLAAVPPIGPPPEVLPAFPCDVLADLPDPHDPSLSVELNLSTGLFSVHIDLDGDGRPDLALLFHVLQTSDSLSEDPPWIDVSPIPAFLYLDRNQDGRWDELWVNRLGSSDCRTWEFYSVIRPG